MMTAILAGLPGVGGAKGCLKGAVVGGAVGHVAGHHAVAGAAAGCVIEHHREKVKAREARQNAGSEAPRAGTGRRGDGRRGGRAARGDGRLGNYELSSSSGDLIC